MNNTENDSGNPKAAGLTHDGAQQANTRLCRVRSWRSVKEKTPLTVTRNSLQMLHWLLDSLTKIPKHDFHLNVAAN